MHLYNLAAALTAAGMFADATASIVPGVSVGSSHVQTQTSSPGLASFSDRSSLIVQSSGIICLGEDCVSKLKTIVRRERVHERDDDDDDDNDDNDDDDDDDDDDDNDNDDNDDGHDGKKGDMKGAIAGGVVGGLLLLFLLLLLLWYCLKLRRIRHKKRQRRRDRKSEDNDNDDEDDSHHCYAPANDNNNTNGYRNNPGQDNIQLMRYNQSPPPQYREVVPTPAPAPDAGPVFNMSTAPGLARAPGWTTSTSAHHTAPVELPSPTP